MAITSRQHQQCRLLQGPAALAAQALLATAALSSLALKRLYEQPRRPVMVWTFDVSKQVVSSTAAHVCGLVVAILAANAARHLVSSCSLYFFTFLLDTSLGVALTLAFHKAATTAARSWHQRHRNSSLALALAQCGQYGNPPAASVWAVQLIEFTVAVIIARGMCGVLVIQSGVLLVHAAHMLDEVFAGHPEELLAFVMLVCPLLLNLVQVLLQDWVLRWQQLQQTAPPADSPMHQDGRGDDGHESLLPARRRSTHAPHSSDCLQFKQDACHQQL